MAFALEARSVTKTYQVGDGTVNAVDEVDLDLQRGEFVALVGPSGSGKTTMLAIVAVLLSPTSGSIKIDGHDLATMREAQRARFRRRNIGFTFQANNLVSYLTALENVELMLRLNGEFNAAGRKRARELLVRLGLEERMNALPRQLSGGQRQRVAIARSLINQPTLVLADEPTASLDTERAFQVVETLASLVHEQNRAGIMVTHDLRLVQYTDRVVQLLDGHVERIVSPEEDLACLADPAECSMIPMDVLGLEEARKEGETHDNQNRDG
jgi:putative ABC transport system ATP-binding protein